MSMVQVSKSDNQINLPTIDFNVGGGSNIMFAEYINMNSPLILKQMSSTCTSRIKVHVSLYNYIHNTKYSAMNRFENNNDTLPWSNIDVKNNISSLPRSMHDFMKSIFKTKHKGTPQGIPKIHVQSESEIVCVSPKSRSLFM